MRHVELFTQLSDAPRYTVERQNTVSPGVSVLLFVCRPSAIPRLVPLRVVNAINCQSIWSKSHVGEEVLKGLPSFANRNSPGSVIMKLVIKGIAASFDHVSPRPIGWSLTSRNRMAVNAFPRFGKVSTKTTAGACVACVQSDIVNFDDPSAFANALASAFVVPNWEIGDYFEPSKAFPDQVKCSMHNVASINVVFSGGRPATTGARCDCFTKTRNTGQPIS